MGNKILIVEDEIIIASDIKQLLQLEGYEIVGITDNADDALDLIQQEKPDLILLDILLVGQTNGIELSRKIRDLNGTKVIFVTAYTEKSTVQEAMLTDPSGYVMKPILDEELLAEVRKAFQ